MHYRNGREAQNGDKAVLLDEKGGVKAAGVLVNATSIPIIAIQPLQ